MNDDELAHAWESFATALREVPARRLERWMCRPTCLADLGQKQEAWQYQKLAMHSAANHYRIRGFSSGIFQAGMSGLGITL